VVVTKFDVKRTPESMVKLTFESVNSKLGKAGDPAGLTEISLPNKQIDELGSFAKFTKLKVLDLRNNRLRFKRNIEGLFRAPALQVLDLRGNPVCNESGYRQYVIQNMPQLIKLDDVPVTEEERRSIRTPQSSAGSPISHPLEVQHPLAKSTPATEQTLSTQPEPKNAPVIEESNVSTPNKSEATKEIKEEPKTKETKMSVSNKEEIRKEEYKRPEPKKEIKSSELPKEVVKEEPKKTAIKKEELKTNEANKTQPKKTETQKIEPKKAESRESESKTTTTTTTTTTKTPISKNENTKKEEPNVPAQKSDTKETNSAKKSTLATNAQKNKPPNHSNSAQRHTAVVFVDSRTGLEIRHLTAQPELQTMQPNQQRDVEQQAPKFTEESLFGSTSVLNEAALQAPLVDNKLVQLDDNFINVEKMETKQHTTSKAKIAEVHIASEDDELLALVNKGNTKIVTTKTDDKNTDDKDDDLFALVDVKKQKDQLDNDKSQLLNIEEYIAQQKANADNDNENENLFN
jgi:hypothetical protein